MALPCRSLATRQAECTTPWNRLKRTISASSAASPSDSPSNRLAAISGSGTSMRCSKVASSSLAHGVDLLHGEATEQKVQLLAAAMRCAVERPAAPEGKIVVWHRARPVRAERPCPVGFRTLFRSPVFDSRVPRRWIPAFAGMTTLLRYLRRSMRPTLLNPLVCAGTKPQRHRPAHRGAVEQARRTSPPRRACPRARSPLAFAARRPSTGSSRPRIADARIGRTRHARSDRRRASNPRRRAAWAAGGPYRILVEDQTSALELVYFKADAAYLKRLLPEGSRRLISANSNPMTACCKCHIRTMSCRSITQAPRHCL